MPYEPFVERFGELALKETRSATVFPGNEFGLPPDEYGLFESYCNDENCDCRRVFFNVVSRKTNKPIAVVAYGWETEAFYRRWFGGENDPLSRKMVKEMVGLGLNLGSPQSKYANAALKLVESVLQDQNYVARIKRHYQMFKGTVDGKPVQKNVTDKRPEIAESLKAPIDAIFTEQAISKARKRHRPRNTDY
jgi:hypothetical protein